MNKILIIILSLLITINLFPQVFSDEFNGIDSIRISFGGDATIYDFYNDGDSILYIGGSMTFVNDIPIQSIFSWNGDTIKRYMDNTIKGGVECLIKYKDTLYVGGGLSISGTTVKII